MIIGSVHTDLVQYVRELPRGNENAEVLKSETRIAGGGYAAGSFFHELGFPFQVICDPGDGVYGEYARNEALQNEIELLEGSEETGGCTYTLIDQNGSQGVFLVDGSEYHFSLAQVYDINPDEFGQFIRERKDGDPEDVGMHLTPVSIRSLKMVPKVLQFYMGKNTPERKDFIVHHLSADIDA